MNEQIIQFDCIERERMKNFFIITAGSTYLDIDAYACCVAMRELLEHKGVKAIAYSNAHTNYSVVQSLVNTGLMLKELPADFNEVDSRYIIVDVSDPNYIKDSVPLDKVIEVYDHHTGFEDYWQNRIGDNSKIEFIGAAATLIYREWKKSGLEHKMSKSTALLLVAAILDNTLDLTSPITTEEDINAYKELCKIAHIGDEWRAVYFSEVQASIEADLKNAIFGDIKRISDNSILPPNFAQLTIWDAQHILNKLEQIRHWFEDSKGSWMINIIDIKHRISYFVCDDFYHQKEIEKIFGVLFKDGVAKSDIAYLRKEIIKKTKFK